MAHVVPFQRSASVTRLPLALLMTSPTAVHAVAELHDTENRMAPATSGVGWTAHFLPFQRSASAPEVVLPTAVHAVAELHDTPFSEPLPAGSETGRRQHPEQEPRRQERRSHRTRADSFNGPG